MTDDRKTDPEAMLDAAFAEVRAQVSPPRPAMFEAMMADALEAMPPPKPVRTRPAGLRAFLAQIGGWRGGVALAGAALAGVSVGYLDPGSLQDAWLATDLVAVEAGFDDPLSDLVEEIGS